MIDLELLPEFVAEAGEHLDEMEANLIKLEAGPENREIINDIFRDVHTIKGSSAYLGLKVTSELAHKLENLLEMVRQGKRNVDSSLIDTLIAAKDRIASLVADVESYQEERTDTDDLIEAIQNCSNDPDKNEKKVGQPPQSTDFDQDIDLTAATLEGISFKAGQASSLDSTDFDLPRQDTPAGNSQRSPQDISEEEFGLLLDGIFDTEENQSNVPADTFESRKDSPRGLSAIQAASAPQGSFSEDKPVESEVEESYEETGDEELFAIYLEQLKINLSDIRELAAQISSSENRSELLSAINEKIQRLKASANYMGYEKLAGLYERWQAKLESYQDRLFLNDAPSCDTLIEEGINTYFDAIKKNFPQLQEISRVPIASEELAPFPCQPPSSEISDTASPMKNVLGLCDAGIIEESLPPQAENEYEENIDTELFSIFLEQLKDNLHAVRTLGQQLSTSENPLEIVNALAEKITRIRAAANYMGYEKLTELYDGWVGELDAFCDPSFCAANEIDVSKSINGCIRTYTDKVLKIFPQISEDEPVAIDETETTAEEQLRSTPRSSTNETSTVDLSTKALLLDRTDELFSLDDPSIDDETNLFEAPGVTDDEAVELEKDQDRILIDRLSAALDSALGTGIADEGNKDSGKLEYIGTKVEPDQIREDAPLMLKDIPEEKKISLASLEPSELVHPEESEDLARNDENSARRPRAHGSAKRRPAQKRQKDRNRGRRQ